MDKNRIDKIKITYSSTNFCVEIYGIKESDKSSDVSYKFKLNNKDNDVLISPKKIAWWVSDPKGILIGRMRNNKRMNQKANLLQVIIDICRFRNDDLPRYKLTNSCLYAINDPYISGQKRRNDMLTNEEMQSILDELVRLYPEIFGIDPRYINEDYTDDVYDHQYHLFQLKEVVFFLSAYIDGYRGDITEELVSTLENAINGLNTKARELDYNIRTHNTRMIY